MSAHLDRLQTTAERVRIALGLTPEEAVAHVKRAWALNEKRGLTPPPLASVSTDAPTSEEPPEILRTNAIPRAELYQRIDDLTQRLATRERQIHELEQAVLKRDAQIQAQGLKIAELRRALQLGASHRELQLEERIRELEDYHDD